MMSAACRVRPVSVLKILHFYHTVAHLDLLAILRVVPNDGRG